LNGIMFWQLPEWDGQVVPAIVPPQEIEPEEKEQEEGAD